MKPFIIRAYGLQELGQLYFPFSAPKSASTQLKRWINHPQLLRKLAEVGYQNGQKLLTPRQVSVLTEHLGEP